ncbi:MAG TPA: methyltransferase domain-containing protein [Vicinamibacterales bacterium]|jgi:hypothetical protein
MWIENLQARHLADLRLPEVGRALTALSTIYVERRAGLARGAALDSRGKRAAFALFYGPLHFFTVSAIVHALGIARLSVDHLLDLGCGTGAAGAAWARALARPPQMHGVDRHPWAAQEATWTYRALELKGHARVGDATDVRLPRGRTGVLAAYLVNEVPPDRRDRLRISLLEAASRGACVLVVEPIAKTVTPWWPAWQAAFGAAGGRADEWRFPADLPEPVARLGHAAGLDYRELTARTLFMTSESP